MWVLIGSQMIVAFIAAGVMLYRESVDAMVAVLYGASTGIVVTLLVRRSADKVLEKAIDNPQQGIIVMFSGFVLRYMVAILGLLIGFSFLELMAVSLLAGFILMIMVQVFTSHLLKP